MKRMILAACAIVLALAAFSPLSHAAAQPRARAEACVQAGNARFTVLTDRLIRMEWSADGVFEDRASLTFVNRDLPVPAFKVSRSSRRVIIRTAALTLTYRPDGKAFSEANLKAEFSLNGRKVVWVPGMEDTGNLMGTARTLDQADGRKLGKGNVLEKGILSRDGWTVVDDSKNHLFEVKDGEEWLAVRPDGERQDLYLFAYGHDYRGAMADYARVAGPAPMPPRYVFGYWWSRYWQYSDSEVRDLITRLRSLDIPVDVLIVDMDWHETWGMTQYNAPKDEFGQRIGWTGYTWQKELFPNPKNFLQDMHRLGLKTALNLHPASGIQPYESVYEDFCKDYGWKEPGKPVPFKMDEKSWSDSYYRTVLAPMERAGVDFWWLDWQQWKLSKYTPGLSNTFWLNYTFFEYARKNHPDQRPFLYHRWGGLGSHRYPLGFSGDTYSSWESLAYQPEFTATSANVNYGYWGHDLGGHMFKTNTEHTDAEQYLRWLQYGVFSPLYKIHPTKHPNIERYIWLFPEQMFRMREAFYLRYALVPYIYNAARANYDTGIAMCHPLYYDYPERQEAYDYRSEFLFGDDVLALCVGTPSDPATGLSEVKVWLPGGNDWFDMATGHLFKGDSVHSLRYTLDENPWFAKAGSVIPMNPAHVRSLKSACDTLVLTAVPGADGRLSYYEDDGISQRYAKEYARTEVLHTRSAASVRLRIEPRRGSYEGAPATRSYELRFPCTPTPVAVRVNGREIPYARFAASGQWTYEALTLAPTVYLSDCPVDTPLEVELVLDPSQDATRLYGLQGLFGRCNALCEPYKMEQGIHDRNKMLPRSYLKVAQCPNFIRENPQELFRFVTDLQQNLPEYARGLDQENLIGDAFKAKIRAQVAQYTFTE